MNRSLIILMMIAVAGTGSVSAAVVAGWESWKWAGAPVAPMISDATVHNGVTGYAVQSGPWNMMAKAASTDGTFGSMASSSADATVESPYDGYALSNGDNGYIDFKITNTQTDELKLDSFRFDVTRLRSGSPEKWVLEVLKGGALTAGVVRSGRLDVYNESTDLPDLDVMLSGLADPILEAQGTVVFRLSFTGGNGGHGQHTYLDNVAVTLAEKKTLGFIVAMR